MGIQVVGNKDYFFCPWVQGVGCIPEDFCKIQRRSALLHNRFPPACQRLGNHEDICNAITDIYGIHFLRLSRSTGDTDFLYKLLVRFIYAYNRTEGIIGALVYLQHILHLRYEFSICLRNAPFLYKPRLDFVFFITSQTVVSVM